MLWILLAIVLLVFLRTRVGVWTAFGGDVFRLDVKIGFLRLRILPAKPQKPRPEKPKKEKKPKKSKKEKPEGEKTKPSIAWEDVRDALHTLLPALGRTLRRIGRGIQVKPLRLFLVLGGQEDPAASARLYGQLQAAVWGGMPHVEKLVDIREVCIRTDVDFTSADTKAEGEAGVTFRIGTLIAAGFGLAVPALKWFLRWRKRCKARLAEAPEEAPDAAVPDAASA